jgi:hypothetical protein
MGVSPYPRARGAAGTSRRPRHDPAQRLNDDHTDDLVLLARTLAGHPDATAARAERVDRHGIELTVDMPGAVATVRVAFREPVTDDTPSAVRVAFRRLVRQARAPLSSDAHEFAES